MLKACIPTSLARAGFRHGRWLSSPTSSAQDSKDVETPSKVTNVKPFEDIPGPPSLPFVGSFFNYLPVVGKYSFRKFHDANYQKFLKYGKVVREDLPGNRNLVFVFDPEDIKQLSQKEGKFPSRRPFDCFREYWERRTGKKTGLGFFIDQGQDWYDLRSKVHVDLMKLNVVSRYIPDMEDVSMDMTNRMAYMRDSRGEIPDFLNELYKWALESISLVALDTRLGCLQRDLSPNSEPQQMIDATYATFEEIWKLEFSLKMWKYFPTPAWIRFSRALDCQSRISAKYVGKAMERLKKDTSDKDNLTFLETFLLKEDLEQEVALRMVRDLLSAGIDTTAHTAGFALYQLAKNPDAQERMFREVKSVLPSVGDRLTASKKNELHYVRACVKETLRVCPIFDYTRELNEDIELGGYHIPKGANVVVQNQILSNMEAYFPEAHRFKPERWLRDADKEYEPFAYLPFGFGTRSCVGRRIAEQEIIIFLAKAIQRFRIEYHHEDISVRFRVLNMPDKPLRLKFIDRNA